MAKSIMHDKKDKTCYLCILLHGDYTQKLTQEHHAIFGSGRRQLAEKYGLKVYLCLGHHTAGKESVHQNREMAELLKQQAQKDFEQRYPDLNFLRIFGRSYQGEDCGVGEGGATGRQGKEVTGQHEREMAGQQGKEVAGQREKEEAEQQEKEVIGQQGSGFFFL